jgi:hypothetical protein
MRVLSIIFILLLSGCAKNYNNEVATYKAVGSRYVLTVTGMRGNMAHDPISLLFRGSHEASQSFDIPRISGTVKGSEIITPKGYYGFLGQINFSGENVTMQLLINNYDDNTQPELNWNGKYVLKQE